MRDVLVALMATVDALQSTMPEESYRQLCNAVKRVYDANADEGTGSGAEDSRINGVGYCHDRDDAILRPGDLVVAPDDFIYEVEAVFKHAVPGHYLLQLRPDAAGTVVGLIDAGATRKLGVHATIDVYLRGGACYRGVQFSQWGDGSLTVMRARGDYRAIPLHRVSYVSHVAATESVD